MRGKELAWANARSAVSRMGHQNVTLKMDSLVFLPGRPGTRGEGSISLCPFARLELEARRPDTTMVQFKRALT